MRCIVDGKLDRSCFDIIVIARMGIFEVTTTADDIASSLFGTTSEKGSPTNPCKQTFFHPLWSSTRLLSHLWSNKAQFSTGTSLGCLQSAGSSKAAQHAEARFQLGDGYEIFPLHRNFIHDMSVAKTHVMPVDDQSTGSGSPTATNHQAIATAITQSADAQLSTFRMTTAATKFDFNVRVVVPKANIRRLVKECNDEVELGYWTINNPGSSSAGASASVGRGGSSSGVVEDVHYGELQGVTMDEDEDDDDDQGSDEEAVMFGASVTTEKVTRSPPAFKKGSIVDVDVTDNLLATSAAVVVNAAGTGVGGVGAGVQALFGWVNLTTPSSPKKGNDTTMSNRTHSSLVESWAAEKAILENRIKELEALLTVERSKI